MDQLNEILAMQVGDNTVRNFVVAFVWFIGLFFAFKIFTKVVVKRLDKLAEKTSNNFDDALIDVINNIHWFFYVVLALYFPLMMLALNETAVSWIHGIFVVAFVYEFIRFLMGLIDVGLRSMAKKKGNEDASAFQGIRLVIKIFLWVTGLLLVLSNLGFDITSLVAGLGIGGIAIALAVQNILGDMFSSFSIVFDKPFIVGDYIVIGTDKGVVKKIGLKTTRLETLQGEELIISNKELTSVRLQNFKKMKQRRITFNIGVTYETSAKRLKEIDVLIEKIIKKVKDTEFVRCHFQGFGEFSLNFEVVYFVKSGDYSIFMDKQEEINFAIVDAFGKNKIEMAYPTQTLFVKK
ncbi:MAG: mechanosensitive ion channel family protein [bacterium]|nr:mechanosensitive ion channel family protein [bacterium]